MIPASTARASAWFGLAAILCAAIVGLLGWLVNHTACGQRLDGELLLAVAQDEGVVALALASISSSLTGTVALACAAAAAVVALARRRPSLILLAGVLVGVSHLATQILKHEVYVRERLTDGLAITPNSYPSGHTTLTLACVCALLLVVPVRWARWLAIPGAAWASAVGIGVVAASWHRPSDVLGASLVVAAVLCALAAISPLVRRQPRPAWVSPTWPLLAGAALTDTTAVAAAMASPDHAMVLTSLAITAAMATVAWLAASLDL